MRALVRRPAAAQALADNGVELCQGDLANREALQALTAECVAVIHSAGAVRGNSQEDFDRVNVAGTAALAELLAKRADNPRLILLSSVTAGQPHLSWYARSKERAEQMLHHHPDLDWVILRPPAVYGPGDKEMLPIFRAMYRGIAPVPGAITARVSLIQVDDLADAIIACMQSSSAAHQTFTLHDGRPGGYDWQEMSGIAAQLWSRRVHTWQVPPWLLNTVAACNTRLAAITGRAPMLTPPKLRELRHPDWVMDNAAISACTGWTPTIQLREGLDLLKIPAL